MIKFSINGKSFSIGSGSDINIKNGRIMVDGEIVTDEAKDILRIEIDGDVVNLQADGSVQCDNVLGDLTAGGSVQCDDVMGDVNAGGSVNCDDVKGSVNAGGSINHG